MKFEVSALEVDVPLDATCGEVKKHILKVYGVRVHVVNKDSSERLRSAEKLRDCPVAVVVIPAVVTLFVKNEDDTEISYKIERDRAFEKLMKRHCMECNLEQDNVVFMYDDAELDSGQTADNVDMVDGGIVYVVQRREP